MATPGDQSLDGVIACLVSMGFDLNDAQSAVQNGKLTVEEAIEWIVKGKPPVETVARSGPVLRLNRNTEIEGTMGNVGSNPFSNPQPITAPTEPSSSAPEPMEEEETRVTSRLNRGEEQRLYKQRFEEKQREDTRKKLKQEKMALKKEHEQILKEIAKDREIQKMKKVQNTPAAQAYHAVTASSNVAAQPAEAPAKCLLQIRLPDGRALRHSFFPDSLLQEVWQFTRTSWPDMEGMCFMQPFPRQEYNETHMNKTLQELKLVPSGSLVVKKSTQPDHGRMNREPGDGSEMPESLNNEAHGQQAGALSPQHPEGMIDNLHQQASQNAPADESDLEVPPEDPIAPYISQYKWGVGHRLTDEPEPEQPPQAEQPPQPPQAEGMDEAGSDEESDSEEEHMVMPFGDLMPGNVGHGMAQQGVFHDWGFGQALLQNPNVLEPSHMAHHGKDPKELAASAACQRFQAAPAVAMEIDPAPSTSHFHHTIQPLSEMLVQHVTGRICDSRHPIVGLQGLPTDVAMTILTHLIKEKLLKPKTLNVFISCRLKRLVLDSYPYTTNELLAAIRLHSFLTHLSLGACPLITERGLQYLQSLHRLRYLSLLNCPQIADPATATLAAFPNLSTLVLEGTGITDRGISQLSQAAGGNLQNLSSLNLNRTQVTHEVFQYLPTFVNLRSLSMENTQIMNLNGIERLSGLEVLNISRTAVPTECLEVLGQLSNLTALNVANMSEADGDITLSYIAGLRLQLLRLPNRLSTSDRGMQYLVDMPLHTLDLTNYTLVAVSSAGAQSIGRITSLRKLYLSNTGLHDEGMLYLQGLTKLEELHLDRTSITDAGAEVIRAFQNLQELSLSETRITNQCLCAGVFNSCQMLSRLNLSKTAITTKGASCVKLLYLTLLNLDGTGVREEVEAVLKANCLQLRRVTMVNITEVKSEDEDE